VWKIADFGLTATGTSQKSYTTRYSRGTSGYRAPELVNEETEKRTYNNKVDIWAIGCIFFEVIYRRKAFTHDLAVQQYFQGSRRGEKLGIPLQMDTVPDEGTEVVTSLLYRMLDTEPSKRPKADELYGVFNETFNWAILTHSTPSFMRPASITISPPSTQRSTPLPHGMSYIRWRSCVLKVRVLQLIFLLACTIISH
jgi:serine/threonine protein kinase